MSIELKGRDLLFAIIIALLFIALMYQGCNNSKETAFLKSEYESKLDFWKKRDSVNLLKLTEQANQIVITKQNIVSEKSAKEMMGKQANKYKKIASYYESKMTTGIKDKSISYIVDTFYVDSAVSDCIPVDDLKKNYVRVGNKFYEKDKWMTISGRIGKDSIQFDTIGFANEIDIIIGTKGEGFLGRIKDPEVMTTSYSPYNQISYVNNIIVDDRRSKTEKVFLSKPAMVLYGIIIGILTKK